MRIKPALRALFSWRGRLGRRGFASAAFGIYLAMFPVNVIGTLAWTTLHPGQPDDQGLPESLRAYAPPHNIADWVEIGAMCLFLVLVLAMISISIRRFHDMSLSAWGVALAVVVFMALPEVDVPMPFGSLWQWVWLVALSALPGTPEANEFGPGPDGRQLESAT